MEVVMGSNATAQIVTHPRLQPSAPAACQDTGSVPVFWIYIDDEGCWRVRKEGGAAEAAFGSRDAAIAFVNDLAGTLPCRLFIEAQDGRVLQEHHVAVSSSSGEPARSPNGSINPSAIADEATNEARPSAISELGRRLEWAKQLESSARFSSPSRASLLADLFHRPRR
jgi:hypothetical protein